MKTSLSKSSNFPMSSKSIPYSCSSTVTTFCKGLSTSFSSLFMNLFSFSFWSDYRIKCFFSYHVLVNLLQFSVWIINNHFVTIFLAILHTESYNEIANNILKQGFIMALCFRDMVETCYIKAVFNTSVFLWILRNSQEHLFWRIPRTPRATLVIESRL